MSAWEGVDLAVVREAAAGDLLKEPIRLTLGNAFGGSKVVYVERETRTASGRTKVVRIVPGPLVADDHATILRTLADLLDGTVDSLTVTDPRDGTQP